MIFPRSTAETPQPKTVTLADGQTLTVLVVRPNYQQRFNDEGRELKAYAGHDPDGWASYRLGRIRDAIVDWSDVTNDKDQPIPFSTARLLGLMDAAPEVVSQLATIANEAFRPLVLTPHSNALPVSSGEQAKPAEQPTSQSESIANSGDSEVSPEPPASQSGS